MTTPPDRNGFHLKLSDGTVWPVPNVDESDSDALAWIARYGTAEQLVRHRYAIASVVNAYDSLIIATKKRREMVVRELRKARRDPVAPAPLAAPEAPGAAGARAFHDHLDACAQCRERPFQLCPIGAARLKKAALP